MKSGRGVLVGTFVLNRENVRLFLTRGEGGLCGYAVLAPEDDSTPYLDVKGIGVSNYSLVLGTLLHEALEFCLHRRRLGYYCENETHPTPADYAFIMTHGQFDMMAADIGCFLAECMVPLRKAWERELARIHAKGDR